MKNMNLSDVDLFTLMESVWGYNFIQRPNGKTISTQ